MKIAGNGRAPSAGIARSTSADSFWRPNALRRTVMSIRPSVGWSRPATSRAATIIPMHVPQSGMPARTRATIGSASSKRSSSFMTVVDSPPGMTERVDALADRRASLPAMRAAPGALERGDVLDDVALQREYADRRRASCRAARAAPIRSSVRMSRPGIASRAPSDRHASSTTLGIVEMRRRVDDRFGERLRDSST